MSSFDQFKSTLTSEFFQTLEDHFSYLYESYENCKTSIEKGPNDEESIYSFVSSSLPQLDPAIFINKLNDINYHKLPIGSTGIVVRGLGGIFEIFKSRFPQKLPSDNFTAIYNSWISSNLFYKNLSDAGKKDFMTAEILYHFLPKTRTNDIHVILHSRVIEHELRARFIKPLESWATEHKEKIQTGAHRNIINDFSKVTIGTFKYLIIKENVQKFIKSYFINCADTIIDVIPNLLEKIRSVRNKASHIETCTNEEVIRFRNVLFEESLYSRILEISYA